MGRVIWPACFKSRSAAQAEEHFKGVAPAFQRAWRVVARGQRFQIAVAPQGQRVGRAALKAVGLGRVASALLFAAAGEPFDGGDAFGCGHGYVTMRWFGPVPDARFRHPVRLCGKSLAGSGASGWRAGLATPRQVRRFAPPPPPQNPSGWFCSRGPATFTSMRPTWATASGASRSSRNS